MQHNQPNPKLAPPGAGIPWTDRLLGHLFLRPFVAEKTPWQTSTERFLKNHSKILKELEGLSPDQLNAKILVPPQKGLEDSSRFWSVAMTLEHLLIVGNRIQTGIIELSTGRTINEKVDIAKVKPQGSKDLGHLLSDFKNFAENTPKIIASQIQDQNSKAKYYHPWFGSLSMTGWYWLLAMHGGIHLQQIREIKKGLGLVTNLK